MAFTTAKGAMPFGGGDDIDFFESLGGEGEEESALQRLLALLSRVASALLLSLCIVLLPPSLPHSLSPPLTHSSRRLTPFSWHAIKVDQTSISLSLRGSSHP